MTTTPRFTSADLDAFPDDGKRYEIIDGELYVSIRIYSIEANLRLHKTNGLGRKKYFFGTIGITMPHI